tara:strand:- start:1073 stop:2836 length:1764 start_codon:yes stop_codon:yes gene_type:complete
MSSSIFVRVFSVVLLIVSFSHSVHAKEYSIPELQIEVQINNDGTITITEHRTYVFDGSYSWANYRLPKSGYSAMRNIQVSEGDHSLINLNTEEPETFLVEESDKAFNIKWFFDAEDEERTFTITYTLENALVIGPDWSELFWTYAASGREKSTDDFEILIRLPEMVPDSSLKSWVREPAWDISSNLLENGFQFTGENISRKQAVIVRAIFPTSVFDENMVQVTDPDFSMALAEQQEANFREEQRLAAEDEQRRLALAIEISIIVAGISIIVFIFFYRKYGSRHKIALSVNESIMLPGREKPATIGWLLMNRTVSHNLIMATLLDLARRGYFTIKENEPEEEGWMSSDDPYFSVHPEEKSPERNLTDYELNLLNFVNERISEEGNKMEEIFAFGKSDVTKWFYAWKEKLTDHCKDQKWIDPESYTGAYWNAGIQSILLLASVSAIFLLHPLMFLAMGISFVGLILSFVIIRRTPKGEELYRRWSSYRKALQNAKDHSISEEVLGMHFIYAIAFGLGKQPVESMFEQHPGAVTSIYWIAILPGMSSSPANIASSFSTLAATATSSASGGGFSGGASAGAAGGGASGGAG